MRLLSLSTSYPKSPTDTTAPFIRSISHGLAAHGWEVHLLLPFHPDLAWPQGDPPVHLHTYPYLPRRWARLHRWGYAASLRSDVAVRPEVLAVLPLAAASGLIHLVRLLRRLEPDLVHAHWLLPNGPLAALAARLTGRPLAISLHGSDLFLAERSPVLRGAARFALRTAGAVTACSRDLAARARRLGAPAAGTFVIPYGVDPEAFRPATAEDRRRLHAELGIEPQVPLILAVGRLVYKKGFEFLLRALPRLRPRTPPPLLLIAGAGDLEEELKGLARRLGVEDQVRFLGNVPRDRIPLLFRGCDVLAVPSVHDAKGNVDGLPNVILEGMGSGTAIVASRVAGIPEVIEDGVHGLLTPEKDPEALARALDRLLEDPELRARLGAAARARAETELSWAAVTARYSQALGHALGG